MSEQYGVKVYKILAFPVMSAKHIEREMHQFFANDSTGVYARSSGGSEWFSRSNWWAFAFALVIGLLHTDLPQLTVVFYSLLILSVPLPLDAIFCLYLQWIVTELRRSFFYALIVIFSLINVALIVKALLLII